MTIRKTAISIRKDRYGNVTLPAAGKTTMFSTWSDPVKEVQESLGQRLIAIGVATVDPAECGEHQAARVEFEHGRQVADLARLIGQPLVGDADPVAARVAAGDGDADAERAEVGAGPDGGLPDDEHERHQQVSRVGGHGVRAPDALTDVPGVHPVVHQLTAGVD